MDTVVSQKRIVCSNKDFLRITINCDLKISPRSLPFSRLFCLLEIKFYKNYFQYIFKNLRHQLHPRQGIHYKQSFVEYRKYMRHFP